MITITLPCTQREQIEQLVHNIKITHIDTQQVEKEALVYQEIQHLAGGDYNCDVYSAPQSTKNRWTVNYIRHCLSDYELALYDLDAIDGDKNRNYAYFKELLLHRIMKIYPQYTDECKSQIQHEREKYSSKTKTRKET